MLNFVPLPARLFGERSVWGELEIVGQVVEQRGIVLELDVDVGEHKVERRIVGPEFGRGHGAWFGFGGALQFHKRAGQLCMALPAVRIDLDTLARVGFGIGEALCVQEKFAKAEIRVRVLLMADFD